MKICICILNFKAIIIISEYLAQILEKRLKLHNNSVSLNIIFS